MNQGFEYEIVVSDPISTDIYFTMKCESGEAAYAALPNVQASLKPGLVAVVDIYRISTTRIFVNPVV